MKRTELKRKTPLKSNKGLASKRTMTAAYKPYKKSSRARAREFPPKVRAIVKERSGGVCERCGVQRAVHLHHAVYRSQHGTGDIDNAISLCRDCHSLAHGSREVREWCVERAKQLANAQPDQPLYIQC